MVWLATTRAARRAGWEIQTALVIITSFLTQHTHGQLFPQCLPFSESRHICDQNTISQGKAHNLHHSHCPGHQGHSYQPPLNISTSLSDDLAQFYLLFLPQFLQNLLAKVEISQSSNLCKTGCNCSSDSEKLFPLLSPFPFYEENALQVYVPSPSFLSSRHTSMYTLHWLGRWFWMSSLRADLTDPHHDVELCVLREGRKSSQN